MLTALEIWSDHGGTMLLPLEDPSEGFALTDIEGLGPVKATIVSSRSAQLDGTKYQNSYRESRNLKVTIGLEPDFSLGQSVYDLRQRLYTFFMPKSEVEIHFQIEGMEVTRITGRVETCEPNVFSKEPEVVVTIICFDSDFLGTVPVTRSFSTSPTTAEEELMYAGTVPTGVNFEMTISHNITQFHLRNVNGANEYQDMNFVGNLLAGDKILISTTPGAKSIYLQRGTSTPTSILYGMDPNAEWLLLAPGLNRLSVIMAGAVDPYKITYTARYGGL